MNNPLAVEIKSLTKEFNTNIRRKNVQAIRDVSLSIKAGEIYGLIGPNGSGKSTTMKALLGLLAPTSGHCFIFGNDSLRVDSRQEVGFLPENPYFYKHLTGLETLLFYGKLCQLNQKTLHKRTAELLDLVGLTQAKNRRVGTYSKGMLQRIGLAQALIQKPRLLILDEPTAGVDPVGARQIKDLILELKKQGVTIFLCSHLLEQVQEVCDRIGIIHHGQMIREGSLEQLIAVEDQVEITLRHAEADLIQKIKDLVESENSRTTWIGTKTSRTTLEQIFIQETQS